MKMIVINLLLIAFTIFLVCEASSSDLTEPLLGRKTSFKESEAQVHGHRASSSSSHSGTGISSPTMNKPASPKKKTAEEIHIQNAINHEKEVERHKSERLKWKEGEKSNWKMMRFWSGVRVLDHENQVRRNSNKAKDEREKAEKAKKQAGSSRT